MEQERSFSIFLHELFILDFRIFSLDYWPQVISTRSGVSFLLIDNSIKLKYKVTLLVHKRRNTSYTSSVLFIINLNWKNVLSFYFLITGQSHPGFQLVLQKLRISVPRTHFFENTVLTPFVVTRTGLTYSYFSSVLSWKTMTNVCNHACGYESI